MKQTTTQEKKKKLKLRKGFTLMEFLIVIAIIGLLASIIFASFTAAKAKADDAQVISDAAKVRVALEFYAEDNNYAFPPNININNLCENAAEALAPLVPKYLAEVPVYPRNNEAAGICYKYYTTGTTAVFFGPMVLEKYENTSINKQTGVVVGKRDVDSLKAVCDTAVNNPSYSFILYPVFDVTKTASAACAPGDATHVTSADRIMGITEGSVTEGTGGSDSNTPQ